MSSVREERAGLAGAVAVATPLARSLRTVGPASTDSRARQVQRELARRLDECGQVVRIGTTRRHGPGQRLQADITGIAPATPGRATFEVERLIGGGFAGQVYRARLLELRLDGAPIPGLVPGETYALKILVPPSSTARRFRDLLYRIGFQAPFSAQVDPDAARLGPLWQTVIRRTARLRFGSDRVVVNTHATFFDEELGAFAEVNEWVSGRTWRLGSDPRASRTTRRPLDNAPAPGSGTDSEYHAKRQFMAQFAKLIRELGAVEMARQYEWGTWKSQPNVLKRLDGAGELTAIDFRAGLVLLLGLPLSPADLALMARGLLRGRLAQFDGADPAALESFIAAHRADFADLDPVLDELRRREARLRESLPDLLNRPWRIARLALDHRLHAALAGAWCRSGFIDAATAAQLGRSRLRFHLMNLLWWTPLIGRPLMGLLGDQARREHLARLLSSPAYLMQRLRAGRFAALIRWQRDGRVGSERARELADRPGRFALERLLLGWLPPRTHRLLANPARALRSARVALASRIRLCTDPRRRGRWLRRLLHEARIEGMIAPEEERELVRRVDDPIIQKYLECLAVQACLSLAATLGRLVVAAVLSIRLGSSVGQGLGFAAGFLVLTQVLPITPGSLARGTYVLWRMFRERNVRDYRIAAAVSVWHYIGYLGVPIQMAAREPALARILITRWARRLVHLVPVFGERGALLEYRVVQLVSRLSLGPRPDPARPDGLRLDPPERPTPTSSIPASVRSLP